MDIPIGYRNLIRRFICRGYRDSFFVSDFDKKNTVFFRHDIDLCLIKARNIAFCEYEEGVKSTYFVLLDTEFYNPFSNEGRKILREIRSFGHEIGLHFDAAPFNDTQALTQRVDQECDMLESIIDAPVRVVAPHRPEPDFLGNPDAICGRIHPYQPSFFSDIQYVSDSLGGWTRDHPIDCSAFREGSAIQLLTHPYIWTTAPHLSQTERIQETLYQKFNALDRAARVNFKTYKPRRSPVAAAALIRELRA